MKWWPFKLNGYEKFWAPMFGGGMASAVTVFVLIAVNKITGYVELPSPEIVSGAIGAVVGTVFGAAASFIAKTTEPVPDAPQPPVEPAP